MYENLYFIKTSEDFTLGELYNLSINKNKIFSSLSLSKKDNSYVKNGIYTSQTIDLKPCKKFLVSWNCDTPIGTYIEVQSRAFICYYDENNIETYEWSDWLSFGKWGNHVKRISLSPDTDIAKINTDEFTIKGTDSDTTSKIQIRALLHTQDENVTPSIRSFTVSYKANAPRIKSIDIPYNKIIEVPSYSQYVREKNIGGVICSPTSVTMLLNRQGENLIVEETAWSCFDYNYNAFGNWLFNVGYASSLGYESFVEYGNLKCLKREIYNDHPVAVSVKYTNDINNTNYPYIENAPITTDGHILVVCGFEKVNDTTYVVVNDPAGKDNDSVLRRYKLEEFENAWNRENNIMYVIHNKEVEISKKRVNVNLELVNSDLSNNLYSVLLDKTPIDLSNSFAKTILLTFDDGKTFEYITPYNDSYLYLDYKEKGKLYIVGSDGFTYYCDIN